MLQVLTFIQPISLFVHHLLLVVDLQNDTAYVAVFAFSSMLVKENVNWVPVILL